MSSIHLGDSFEYLSSLPDESVDLIYIDPPFNTGKIQSLTRRGATLSYMDRYDDYIDAFLLPHLAEARRVLSSSGSMFLHIDYRESHYAKIALDDVFGRKSFMNEIIWAYDYGGRSKSRWSSKHDTIFWYAKDELNYTFHFEEMDRIPYMAPGLVGKEKAARGKTPTDVWWHTIVPTNGRERTGYPNQKPLGIVSRIVKVHSSPGDTILDFFAGSGTTGEAAALHGRFFQLVDNNPEAVEIAAVRLAAYNPTCVGFDLKVETP